MASRSLNKVELIGNLTRDPELRYTPSGTSVCTFSVATNRQWVTENGEKKEDVEFHRLVSWQKLAEICGKFLAKGRRVWIQGRLQTRSWTTQDGQQRQTTEIVVEDMIMLDSRAATDIQADSAGSNYPQTKQNGTDESKKQQDKKQVKAETVHEPEPEKKKEQKEPKTAKTETAGGAEIAKDETVSPDDIPF